MIKRSVSRARFLFALPAAFLQEGFWSALPLNQQSGWCSRQKIDKPCQRATAVLPGSILGLPHLARPAASKQSELCGTQTQARSTDQQTGGKLTADRSRHMSSALVVFRARLRPVSTSSCLEAFKLFWACVFTSSILDSSTFTFHAVLDAPPSRPLAAQLLRAVCCVCTEQRCITFLFPFSCDRPRPRFDLTPFVNPLPGVQWLIWPAINHPPYAFLGRWYVLALRSVHTLPFLPSCFSPDFPFPVLTDIIPRHPLDLSNNPTLVPFLYLMFPTGREANF